MSAHHHCDDPTCTARDCRADARAAELTAYERATDAELAALDRLRGPAHAAAPYPWRHGALDVLDARDESVAQTADAAVAALVAAAVTALPRVLVRLWAAECRAAALELTLDLVTGHLAAALGRDGDGTMRDEIESAARCARDALESHAGAPSPDAGGGAAAPPRPWGPTADDARRGRAIVERIVWSLREMPGGEMMSAWDRLSDAGRRDARAEWVGRVASVLASLRESDAPGARR